LDCPIANYAEEKDYTMYVAVHNPSADPISQASFAVPHGHYKLKAFNKQSQNFEEVPSTVLCNEDNLANGQTLKSCFLHADVVTVQKDVSLLALTYDETVNQEAAMDNLKVNDNIQTDDLELTFVGSDHSTIYFTFKNKLTG
jgi:hypothetical protein